MRVVVIGSVSDEPESVIEEILIKVEPGNDGLQAATGKAVKWLRELADGLEEGAKS